MMCNGEIKITKLVVAIRLLCCLLCEKNDQTEIVK